MIELPIEETARIAAAWLRLGVAVLGASIVRAGVLVTAYRYVLSVLARHALPFDRIRIDFARYLALALEFQLGANILSTAIAPSWDEIGKLGAIAIIRTALNFFLTREMREERERIRRVGLEAGAYSQEMLHETAHFFGRSAAH